jgi:hypothetical protein
MPDDRVPGVMKSEELDAAVERLLEEGSELGRALLDVPGRVRRSSPIKPDISDRYRRNLRRALESEITPVVPTASDLTIDARELHRELIKKALTSLGSAKLRQLAKSQVVTTTGNIEEVAERLARSLDWDEVEVAKLVMENEDEPSTERSHSDRVFPIGEVDYDKVQQQLEYVLGRYVRIGVARWFFFQSMTTSSAALTLAGAVVTYRAPAEGGDEGVPLLNPLRNQTAVRVELRRGETVVRLRDVGPTAAKAAMAGLAAATTIVPVQHVALAQVQGEARTIGADPSSLFMIDLVANRLKASGFGQINLTVARFKLGEDDATQTDSRPALRAVRLEGNHIWDSIPACRLAALEGRAMTEIALTVLTRATSDLPPRRYPIRITLERDHVLVTTGFGADSPEQCLDVHRSVIYAVTQEIRLGFGDEQSLGSLLRRMVVRANESTEPDRAEMLADVTDEDD